MCAEIHCYYVSIYIVLFGEILKNIFEQKATNRGRYNKRDTVATAVFFYQMIIKKHVVSPKAIYLLQTCLLHSPYHCCCVYTSKVRKREWVTRLLLHAFLSQKATASQECTSTFTFTEDQERRKKKLARHKTRYVWRYIDFVTKFYHSAPASEEKPSRFSCNVCLVRARIYI